MNPNTQRFEWKNGSGQPVTAGGYTLTPQSQALVVSLPYFKWVWNRPVAVVVERGGESLRLPVVDVTRIVQLGLLALSAACWIAFFLFQQRRRAAAPQKQAIGVARRPGNR
jgi:hypothetical protein